MKQIKQSNVPNKIYPFDHITFTHWHERKVRENRFPFGRGIFLFFLNQNIKLFMLFWQLYHFYQITTKVICDTGLPEWL